MFINDSLRFVPTRHRDQQGDAHKRKIQQVRTRAQNGMLLTANTLGLKETAESETHHIKKSCDVDKYRRMEQLTLNTPGARSRLQGGKAQERRLTGVSVF